LIFCVGFIRSRSSYVASGELPPGSLLKKIRSKESVPLLACPAVLSGRFEALLGKPAVAPDYFNRLLDALPASR